MTTGVLFSIRFFHLDPKDAQVELVQRIENDLCLLKRSDELKSVHRHFAGSK
ncbi:MAG: hypothetical protein HY860_00065 [Chlamydiales bacterium]|nr:hypothetical protein [Chlamydiales bacterium]